MMSQQTPVARVIPPQRAWLEEWPTSADLAIAPKDEVLRAWGELDYPRRTLQLREYTERIVEKHDGEVPSDVDTLLALPGVGDYTAQAVTVFTSYVRTPVVDINVRRVLRRHHQGTCLPGTAKRIDMAPVEEFLPLDPMITAETSVALTELGTTVCRATPECEVCPIATSCAWIVAGRPGPEDYEIAAAKRRVQKFEGTNHQARDLLLGVLHAIDSPAEQTVLDAVWDDAHQRSHALFSLLNDGLAEQTPDGRLRLPR